MLDDPKTRFSDLKKFYDDRHFQLTPQQVKVLQDRDTFNDAHPGHVETIGTAPGDPSQTIGAPVDNRPESFAQGVEDGAHHIAANIAGGVGYIGNKIGLTNDIGGDVRRYYDQGAAQATDRGSTAGRLTGEIAMTAPAALVAAPAEAGLAAIGAPAALATGGGLLVGGAVQGALSTNANSPGGVARDAVVGAGANLALGSVAHQLAAIASTPSATTVAGREVLNAADALSRDGISIRPAPADVGGPVARRLTGAVNQSLAGGAILRNRAGGYIDAIEAAKNRAADSLAPTGETAQPLADTAADLLDSNSLGGYRDRARAAANQAYGAAETLSGDPVIPSLPSFSQALASKIAELRNVPGGADSPNVRALENISSDLNTRGYSVSGLRRLRTDLGRQLDATNPNSREIAGALRQPLAQDIDAGLRQQGQGQAADMWQAADSDYAQSRSDLNDIRKVIGPDNARYSPERVAGRISTLIKGNGTGDGDLVGRVLNTLQPDQAARVRASVVQTLGRAKPGNQSAAGDVFSPETFLTNWQDENFSPSAKAALIPDPQARADLDNIGRVSQGAREAGRYRNHSNTAGSFDLLSKIGRVASVAGGATTFGKSLIAEGIAGAAMSSPTAARVGQVITEAFPAARVAQGAATVAQKSAPPVAGYLMNLPRPGQPTDQ
jgi:hypothetical protein